MHPFQFQTISRKGKESWFAGLFLNSNWEVIPQGFSKNPRWDHNPSVENQKISKTFGDGSKPWYLVNPKIAGKWMFIPLKIVLIGIDPYPNIKNISVKHVFLHVLTCTIQYYSFPGKFIV